MRFVPAYCLREGMIVEKNLYNKNGSVLIARNTKLKNSYIERIKKLGYSGIYITDDISKDIEIENVIDDNLRIQAVQSVKKTFVKSTNNNISTTSINESKELIKNIVESIINTRNLMVNIIDIKVFDDYTYYHSTNVAVLSIVLGISMGLRKELLYDLGLGALLHDIGKVFINKNILNKNGKLTKDEYNLIKEHTTLGYNYLNKNVSLPTRAYLSVLQHHERFDGSGYPNNLKGKDISIFGKIIAIADVYDALTSDRPYRKALLPSEAVEYLMASGGSMFDTELIKIFVTKVAPYPLGMCVQLSNGLSGIVCQNYDNAIMRPKIKIVKNENNEEVEPYILDLRDTSENLNITIVKIVDL